MPTPRSACRSAINHWSFGKQLRLTPRSNYKRGQMGLAYEIVINSDPCIAYLMEENTMMMQALVIAHACYGHNSFFKGNYLFKHLDRCRLHHRLPAVCQELHHQCEERHGIDAVERLLDSCHALMNYGVDRYKRPHRSRRGGAAAAEGARSLPAVTGQRRCGAPLRKHTSEQAQHEAALSRRAAGELLYFIEKNAPLLEPWQREIVRIVRKMAQYFYPQRQTQVMNEGWATFWHYTCSTTSMTKAWLTDGFMMEFLQSHTSVVYQPPFDSPYYRGINPYALGFAMFRDMRRICEHPTEEDRRWFPDSPAPTG
jgi:stage V sporulation protein R